MTTFNQINIMATRVISLDTGNHYTGIVIGDIYQEQPWSQHSIKVQYMDVFHYDGKKIKDNYTEYLDNLLKDYIDAAQNTLVVYERLLYDKNMRLMIINKIIRKYFESKGIKVRTLQPNQKQGLAERKSENRKTQVITLANDLLKSSHRFPAKHQDWYMRFQSFERKHDVADALLMIDYLRIHPDCLK